MFYRLKEFSFGALLGAVGIQIGRIFLGDPASIFKLSHHAFALIFIDIINNNLIGKFLAALSAYDVEFNHGS